MTIHCGNKSFDFSNPNVMSQYIYTAQANARLELRTLAAEKVRNRYRAGYIQPSFRPVILNYTDNSWNWDFSRQTTYVNPASSGTAQKEEEKKNNWMWVIVGVVVTAVTGFFLARSWGDYKNQSEALRITSSLKTYCSSRLWDLGKRQDGQSIIFFLDEQHKIDQTKFSWVQKKVALLFSGFLSGTALAVGAFATAPGCILAGQIGLAATVVLTAISWGLHWDDTKNLTALYRQIVGPQGLAKKALDAVHAGVLMDRRVSSLPPVLKEEPEEDQPPPDYSQLQTDISSSSSSPLPSAPPYEYVFGAGEEGLVRELFEDEGAPSSNTNPTTYYDREED